MRLGIDFGTTNSSIARYDGKTLSRLELDLASDNSHVLPSLIYISREQNSVVGTAAAHEYLERETGRAVVWEKRRVGEIDMAAADMSWVETVHILVDTAAQGRLLQYVKTALRDPSYEGTQVFARFYTLDELIGIILGWLKHRAEAEFGEECTDVVIGRPVRFSENPGITARAEEIIYKGARLAGFTGVRFELEPIGAAFYYHSTARDRQRTFIFDFGGGTLDLTVAELGGAAPPRVLATHGILVGGDDLDRRLMQSLRKYFGGADKSNGSKALPAYVLDPLDNWQTMPLLSRPHYMQMINEFEKEGFDKRGIAALRTLVTHNLGFKLFREIEQAKKRLSDKHLTTLDFEYADVQIHETITRRDLERLIVKEIELVEAGVRHTLDLAGVKPRDIDVVLRTGGTSAVPVFARLLEGIFGEDKLAELELLTSVVGGLAVVAQQGGGVEPVYGARYDVANVPLPGTIRLRSSRAAERYAFRIGAQCYADHSYTLLRMPVELSGLPAVRTVQADKNSTTPLYLQFELARPARIFVAHDYDSKVPPDWLRAFQLSPKLIEVDQSGTLRTYRLYYKDCEAGLVRLGGNRAAGQRGDLFMNYLVAIKTEL